MIKDNSPKYSGMRGGRIGGKIRAERMTPEERKEHAKKMALKRWGSQSADEKKDTNTTSSA